jgi:beta-lactamase regulating signal transducer with metallopeptidase domain
MNPFLLTATQWYLQVQLLIIVAWGLAKIITRILRKKRAYISAGDLRRVHHFLILAALSVSLFVPNLASRRPFRAPVQIWSDMAAPLSVSKGPGTLLSFHQHASKESLAAATLGFERGALALWLFIGCFCLLHFLNMARDASKLHRFLAASVPFKKFGSVSVFISAAQAIPFAADFGFKRCVVLPEALLIHPKNFRMALAHELQHLRQRDGIWGYALEFFRGVFFLNPLVHRWIRDVQESHEFACDEALLGQQRVDQTAYARCLYEVAAYAQTLGDTAVPLGTVGMAVPQKLLKRRIEMLFENSVKNRWMAHAVIALSVAITGTVAVAAKSAVADRRMSMAQAQELARKTGADSDMPIVVDEGVLKALNKGVGTERGRMYLRATFKRMKAYEAMFRKKLAAAQLPEELLAVPVVESGYQNFDNGVGAGLWSFIPDTARHFGLQVDDDRDDRLNVELETDAAIQYYLKLYNEFHDWPLALLAYNQGESAVRTAVARTGIRDAFRLVREHQLPKEQEYLPMTMAAIIIFKNPSLLQE